MRNYYHTKRDYLLNCIRESKFASYVEIMEEDAGLHFIMKIDTDLSDRDFCMYAEKNAAPFNRNSILNSILEDNYSDNFIMLSEIS